jgi:hypothetical protein
MTSVAVLLLTFKSLLPSPIREELFAITVVGFITIKLVFFLRGVDCLGYIERQLCYVLFGGLADDVQLWMESVAAAVAAASAAVSAAASQREDRQEYDEQHIS